MQMRTLAIWRGTWSKSVAAFGKRVNQQFIELSLGVQVVGAQGQDHSLTQTDPLLRKILARADAIQPQTTAGVGILKVGVDLGIDHVVVPFIMASWPDSHRSV